MSFHVYRDPRERIRRKLPDTGITWRLLYRPEKHHTQYSLCWEVLQLMDGQKDRRVDLTDPKGYRWISRMLTHNPASAVEDLMRKLNGVEIPAPPANPTSLPPASSE